MIVAGIGCRRGASAEAVLAALDAALVAAGLSREAVSSLATGALKAEEPGLRAAAEQLGLPLVVVEEAALAAVEQHLLTWSDASRRATGSGSLSEAAALAAAGPASRLVAPRFIHEGVTVAFARIHGDIP